MDHSTEVRTSFRSVFNVRGFGALFVGTTLGQLGVSLQILAFSVAVFDQTRSPTWSSVAFAAGFLPQVVGGLFLPSLADRVPTRLLLPLGALLRCASAALLATGILPLTAAIAVIAAAALVQPLFSAGQSALVARLLTRDRYVLGRSLFTMTSLISQLAGLGVGGVLLGFVGTGGALLVAAGCQLVAALVFGLGLPRLPVVGRLNTRWRIGETWHAYREIFAVPLLRSLLLLWWIPLGLFAGAESLTVAYAGQAGASGAVTAVMLAAAPLGGFVGELAVGRGCRPSTRERLVLPLLILLGLGLLPLAFQPRPLIAAVLVGLASLGLAYELGRQAQFRAGLPAGHESVGFGLFGVGVMTTQGVGPLLGGPLASAIGTGPAMAACGAAVMLIGGPLWWLCRQAAGIFPLALPHQTMDEASAPSTGGKGT